MPLVNTVIALGRTETETYTHAQLQTFTDRSNFKKPGVWLVLAWFKKQVARDCNENGSCQLEMAIKAAKRGHLGHCMFLFYVIGYTVL